MLLDGGFAELNIEGAVASGGVLLLFQRGPQNAIVRYPLDETLAALSAGQPLKSAPAIQILDLGLHRRRPAVLHRRDTPARWPHRLLRGRGKTRRTPMTTVPSSAPPLGRSIPKQHCAGFEHLSPPVKVEGIDAVRNGGRLHLAMVTDADDLDSGRR